MTLKDVKLSLSNEEIVKRLEFMKKWNVNNEDLSLSQSLQVYELVVDLIDHYTNVKGEFYICKKPLYHDKWCYNNGFRFDRMDNGFHVFRKEYWYIGLNEKITNKINNTISNKFDEWLDQEISSHNEAFIVEIPEAFKKIKANRPNIEYMTSSIIKVTPSTFGENTTLIPNAPEKGEV